MVMLRGFLVLSIFFLLGEAAQILFALPVSGGVIGMILLTATLMLRGRISDSLAQASGALISVLVLLIMPGVVGIFFQADEFSGQWLAIGLALVLGTLLSVLTTLWLLQRSVKETSQEQRND